MDWQLQEAKARFSEVVKRAQSDGPQAISVHGKPAAVVVSRADYERLSSRKPGLVEFLQASPLKGVDLGVRRSRSRTRRVEL